MTINVLNKYAIEFGVLKDSNGDKSILVSQKTPTDINYFICTYFINVSLEMIEQDILPEINKALNGEPFNDQGGGFTSFLTIGPSICTFDSINIHDGIATIPTQDMRDIFVAWVEWITTNNLAQYL